MAPERAESYHESVEDRLFFNERIWPCHAGGHWWRVEAVELLGGLYGFNESALGNAATKWGARRKIRRHKRQFLREAREAEGKGSES